MLRTQSHRHSKLDSISRPPRMTNPRSGSLIPSSAPAGSLSFSRSVMFYGRTPPSRIMKTALDRDANPAPTIHTRRFSAPSGGRGRAEVS